MRRLFRLALPPLLIAAALPLTIFTIVRASPAEALENGLARTPQMGWNDWNSFGCNISDSLIRQAADAMVNSGMSAAGYRYVNIDDCWSQKSRDGSGNLVADRGKFPNGMKSLADYVHGKGLKLGIYSSAGATTCAGYPASAGHETQDANLWASWGIDYLKYDNCGDKGGRTQQSLYAAMRDALKATGRPILFALCNWGQESVWKWGPSVGNSWRTTGDIQANFNSVMGILDSQVGLESYSGPGGWNDPDMLEVGNGSGLSDTEGRAHFSLWALMNAPLLAGNDIRNMSAATRQTLTNTEVIAVNQDWGGKQGYKLRDDGNSEVWMKPMANGSKAVVLLNRGGGTSTINVTAGALGLGGASSYSVRDLWAHATTTSGGTISASVPAHAAAMYIIAAGDLPPTSPPPTTPPPSTPPTSPPPTSPPPGTAGPVRAVGAGKCLDVPGGSQANNTRLQIWDCNGNAQQQFTYTSSKQLTAYGNKCLDASGHGRSDGTAVIIWDCGGGTNQQWNLNTNGTITGVESGLCLDVTGGSTTNGALVQLWTCNNNSQQQWSTR